MKLSTLTRSYFYFYFQSEQFITRTQFHDIRRCFVHFIVVCRCCHSHFSYYYTTTATIERVIVLCRFYRINTLFNPQQV